MCTAVSFSVKDPYFGRNLDLDFHYDEKITILPRKFPISFRCGRAWNTHFALIGIATIVNNDPLYYDAVNEFGLAMAGLNFPHFAAYYPAKTDQENIAPFEMIPWILCQCKSVSDARNLLQSTNIWAHPYSPQFPLTPLHWIISDKLECLVVEPTVNGLRVCDNPVGVLTNSPTFDYHLNNLANFMNLSAHKSENRFADKLKLTPYSNGMSAIGLPGDLSSASRFVRASFVKCNSVCADDELSAVTQFLHILGSVEQQNGCCITESGLEKTIYSNCYNTAKGICYFTTYENREIFAVDMHRENLDFDQLIAYPIYRKLHINFLNE